MSYLMARKMWARLVLTLTLLLGSVALLSQPAYASYADCDAGQFCTYWNGSGTGAIYYYTGPVGPCIEIGAPWDNNITSVYNRSSHTVTVYQDHNCLALSLMPPVFHPGDAGTYTLWKNDSASSIRFS